MLRLRIQLREEVEYHQLLSDDVIVGSGESVDLLVAQPGIEDQHLRLLARRGRLILVDLSLRGGTRLEHAAIRAPVILAPGQIFEAGDLQFSAWLCADPTALSGRRFGGLFAAGEVDSADLCIRRFSLLPAATTTEAPAAAGEVVLVDSTLSAEVVASWRERISASSRVSCRFLPEIAEHGEGPFGAYLAERFASGIRLSRVERAVNERRVQLPLEAGISLVAQVAEALDVLHQCFGPHGAVDPRAVQLGVDGSVCLLRAPPLARGYEDPERRPYLAPERCYGAPPTRSADVYGLLALADALVPDLLLELRRVETTAPPRLLLAELSDADARPAASEISRALKGMANRVGVDPSSAHISRLVRLLLPASAPPLAVPKTGRTS